MRNPHAPDHAPRDWSEAFAALPPETPSPDALQDVFARIPVQASTHRRSPRLTLALAASLLALACLPLLWRELPRVTTPGPQQRTIAPTPTPEPVASTRPALDTTPPLVTDTASATIAADAQPTHSTPIRIAKTDTPRRKPQHANHAVPTADPADKDMEPLYAESARLEALLALARDDRVASATAVALGSDFEARLSGIDAALAQPSLDVQHRLDLWRERVSALRAYASFESTQRALAASGERYDAMLVSID